MDFLKSGDHVAFTEIYNRYKGLLYIHAYKMLRDEEEAKDVLHELFAALWARGKDLVLHTSLSNYLYSAVRNRVLDVVSHKQVESVYLESLQHFMEEGDCITDHLLREKDLAAIIEREIAALPAKMREVFELSRKANLTHKEIAEQLKISEQTVKKQVSNALKILRVKLGVLVYLVFLLNS